MTEDDIHTHIYQNQFYNPHSNKHLRGNKNRSLVWFKDGNNKIMVLFNLNKKLPELLEIELNVEGGIQEIVPYKNSKLFVIGRYGHIYLIEYVNETLNVVWETQIEKKVNF